jgi:hypothetical protein
VTRPFEGVRVLEVAAWTFVPAAGAALADLGAVRVMADWLAHGEVAPAGPALTGRPVVDALVAAGTAHLARLNETEAPAWTQEPTRILTVRADLTGSHSRL